MHGAGTTRPDPSSMGFSGPENGTVGMFERPAWGFGGDRAFDGEMVRVRQPIPSIVVQSLGARLPAFVQARSYVDEKPDYELDLIYGAPWLTAEPLPVPPRLTHLTPCIRFVLCEPALASGLAQANALPPTDFLIAAEAAHLIVLAEALAIVLSGQLLICVDFADLRFCSSWAPEHRAHGRAIALEGLGDVVMAERLRAWINQSAQDGFGGGVLIVQLASTDTVANHSLNATDVFFRDALSETGDRTAIVTVSIDASVTAVVVVVFRTRADELTRVVEAAQLAPTADLGFRPARKGLGATSAFCGSSSSLSTPTSRPAANRSNTSIVGFTKPRSIRLRYGVATPASTASFSWVSPRAVRKTRTLNASLALAIMPPRRSACAP